MRIHCSLLLLPLVLSAGCAAIRPAPEPPPPAKIGLAKIDHIILIYEENWSFDGLYGHFPGACGLTDAAQHGYPQVDRNGNPLTQLPTPSTNPPIPAGLPVQPFDLTLYGITPDIHTEDLVHLFYHEQLQIDHGRMDKFVAWTDNGSLVLGGYDVTNLPEGKLAQRYCLCDHFFHAAFGGSFLNHQYLIAAAAPRWNQPIPPGFQTEFDPASNRLRDSHLTTDGQYVVNTTYSAVGPHPMETPADELMAPINDVDPSKPDYMPTIGDRMDAAGVTWAWYAGGWNNALHSKYDVNGGARAFQFHQQPFAYYARYAPFNPDGSPNPTNIGPDSHLRDEQDFLADLKTDRLPAVCFFKPVGDQSEHPQYATLRAGQDHVAMLVQAIQNSPYWPHTAIIITYDENGGRWDHVAPPIRDQWGPGTRVPTIIISPYVKPGSIDSANHDTLSILKTIEQRFGVQPVNQRDAGATSLAGDIVAP